MKSLFLTALSLYIGFGLYIYTVQRNFIYFPVAASENRLEERIFKNDGEQIKSTVINQGNNRAIIYFGGNAENVDYNAPQFSALFNDHTLYLIKYRGYAGSTGEPTEEGLYSDALHIYDEIKKSHSQVTVMGRSLGSAVATYLASKREVQKLVLITPFDSILSVAQSQYPIYPISMILKDKHDSLSRATSISAETLVIAAENDRIIQMAHTQRLVEGFERAVHFKVIRGTGHNTISQNPDYYTTIREFL